MVCYHDDIGVKKVKDHDKYYYEITGICNGCNVHLWGIEPKEEIRWKREDQRLNKANKK